MEKELTCIICPMGCRLSVAVENGKVTDIKGNGCKRGISYAEKECLNPVRMITSTVRVINGNMPVVPVKTDRPVPKALIMDCMREINRIKVKAPVKAGDVLIENILNTGAGIIATGGVESEEGG